jgi:hypothetical protein
MQLLRQSTAVTLKIGPFLDDTDGKTAETALAIAQADVRISKNGANIIQKNEATSCTHDELGVYGCPIDITDTNTLGRFQLWVHESGALPVWHEFMVVTANFYGAVTGGDALEVDVIQISSSSTAANNLEDDYDGTGYAKANSTIGTCTTNTDMVGTAGAALAATALTDVTWTDAKAGYLDAAITSRSTVTTGQVNDQVVDVMKTDTTAEPSQGPPPAIPTFEEMVAYIYFRLRNKCETTATEDAVYDNAGTTKLFKATISDNGTTFTKQEYVSGA